MQTPLFLSGPTAVGKSEVALLLAERLRGEIISVDSMQVYRGLDLGTAKPTAAERERVPHHLIDVVGLSEPFDVARFLALAHAAVEDIQSRDRRPILCGGTGFYFKAYVSGLDESPATDPAVRAALEQLPMPDLLQELVEKDPATFERIDRQNRRRVVRALEVIRLTGKPYSAQRVGWASPLDSRPVTNCFAMRRQPEDLRARIEARVERMFQNGLVEETRRLLDHGLATNRTALQAIGYRQVVEHLNKERSLAETVALVKQKTWQFARRQMTWLRHQLPVTWIEAAPESSGMDAVNTIERQLT